MLHAFYVACTCSVVETAGRHNHISSSAYACKIGILRVRVHARCPSCSSVPFRHHHIDTIRAQYVFNVRCCRCSLWIVQKPQEQICNLCFCCFPASHHLLDQRHNRVHWVCACSAQVGAHCPDSLSDRSFLIYGEGNIQGGINSCNGRSATRMLQFVQFMQRGRSSEQLAFDLTLHMNYFLYG